MASAAAMTAEVATIPLDTAKVRLQIQTVKPGETPRYSGIFGTMGKVAAEEGPLALWGGLAPGLFRGGPRGHSGGDEGCRCRVCLHVWTRRRSAIRVGFAS